MCAPASSDQCVSNACAYNQCPTSIQKWIFNTSMAYFKTYNRCFHTETTLDSITHELLFMYTWDFRRKRGKEGDLEIFVVFCTLQSPLKLILLQVAEEKIRLTWLKRLSILRCMCTYSKLPGQSVLATKSNLYHATSSKKGRLERFTT